MSGERTREFCIQCKRVTNHEVRKRETKEYTPDNTPEMNIDWAQGQWDILMCCGCDDVTFRETWTSSEDYNPITHEMKPSVKLYPPRGQHLLPVKSYFSLPSALRRLYREVIDCCNNGSFTLCAGGLRALIDGICKDNGVRKGPVTVTDKKGQTKIIQKDTLEGKIEGLVVAGILTKKHAATLHEHRFLGNEALHELQSPSADGLKLAIEIVEHTFDNLYELPDKAYKLKIQRSGQPPSR